MGEDKTFKSRNMLVLIFEIFLIIIAIGGLTLATSKLMSGSSTIVTFGEYQVEYIGDTEIQFEELQPIDDSKINYNTNEDVIRLEFSLKGVSDNKDEQLIYDIMLSDLDIDCSLLNEYTKWNLYKNQELIYSGNFSSQFDKNILTDNYRLTETQQDLPKYQEEYDKYVLIVWISETCDDLTTCHIINQNEIVNSKINMKVFIAISGGEKVIYQRETSDSQICVNKPQLAEEMIPVYYEDGEWKIADKTNDNETKLWYNYQEAKWANAVFVNTDKYENGKPGNIVKQEDILAYYIWIPRFKYKLWNAEEEITDTYDAYNKGIDIIFESGTHNTGNAICNDTKCTSNNNYLTHPAFANNLRGFWISKYEINEDNKFIPNTNSLKNKTLEEYQDIIQNLSNTYNTNNSIDSHIITNLEWGAVAYLSHSKYGLCLNSICKEIGTNQTTISEANKTDTTTRNVYGVYDMSGATPEYTIGNSTIGSATIEVRIDPDEIWYQKGYISNYKDYSVRGGTDRGIFSSNDIGMYDISTRAVLNIK